MTLYAYQPVCCGKPAVRVGKEVERLKGYTRYYVEWRCPTCKRLQIESHMSDPDAVDDEDEWDFVI